METEVVGRLRPDAEEQPGASRWPLELLEREIMELAAHIHAATCRWLVLVGEFDRREGSAQWGCKSCSQWLSWRCALAPAAAREQVRVARRLRELPGIRAAFGRGELSYSQVRALSRVATPELEEGLLELARHATAAQLEVVLRAYRGVVARELSAAERTHGERYVVCEHDGDGALLIRARLPAEEGALVVAALEAARDSLRAGSTRSRSAGEPPPAASGQRPERAPLHQARVEVPTAGRAVSAGAPLAAAAGPLDQAHVTRGGELSTEGRGVSAEAPFNRDVAAAASLGRPDPTSDREVSAKLEVFPRKRVQIPLGRCPCSRKRGRRAPVSGRSQRRGRLRRFPRCWSARRSRMPSDYASPGQANPGRRLVLRLRARPRGRSVRGAPVARPSCRSRGAPSSLRRRAGGARRA